MPLPLTVRVARGRGIGALGPGGGGAKPYMRFSTRFMLPLKGPPSNENPPYTPVYFCLEA